MLALNLEHIKELAFIHQSCFAKGWNEKDFAEILSGQGAFGFISEEKNGFIICNKVLDEAEIYTVCVLPSERSKGIGFKLVQQAINWAITNHVARIFLEVNELNFPALRVYEKAGFKRIGIRKGYYQSQSTTGEPEDAVIMELELT